MSGIELSDVADERQTLWGRIQTRIDSRLWAWFAPAIVTVIAFVLRMVNLGFPQELAFDESYYVKDSWSLWLLGYEGTWSEGANDAFADGPPLPLESRGAFVVHPPLGKWIIALGMAITGPYNSVGWRLSVAVLGSLTVLLVYLVALLLTRSLTVATVASGLMAIDGLGIVLSRIALLDGILTFFILLGFLFVLLDRREVLPLIEKPRGTVDEPPHLGRVIWTRPWIFSAGLALGAASAVKWSGAYALAVFGIYVVVSDALARRRAGVVFWPTDAAFRQGPVSFILLVPTAVVTYLLSWVGWLATSGGYDRGSASNPLAALWNYHLSAFTFHAGLDTGHPYESPAWQWPLLIRPTSIWVGDGAGCEADRCIATISSIPNPVIWYAGVAASVYLLVKIVRSIRANRTFSFIDAAPLVGLAATYLPWLLLGSRTTFQFYTITMVPFMVLAIALTARDLAGRRDAPKHRRQAGERTVTVFLVTAVLISAFFYPGWTGMSVPYDFWIIHNWLPSWI